MPSIEPDREASKEVGNRSVSVSNALSGSGSSGVNFWGGYLGFVGSYVQEAGGGVHEFPHTGDRKYGQAAERWNLEKRRSSKCTQRSGNADTGYIH